MRLVLAVATAIWLVPGFARAEPSGYLLLPVVGKTVRLGISVTAEGEPPEKALDSFLDKLFDYFDRNGDGILSLEEAGRIFPLPLPGSRSVALDFKKLDRDGDGKGSRDELKQFYRDAGFTAVVADIQSASAEAIRAGQILFDRLDRDGDGKLSKGELECAPALLRAFDADEDEMIAVSEIIAASSVDAAHKPKASVQWHTGGKNDSAPYVSIDLTQRGQPQGTGKKAFRFVRHGDDKSIEELDDKTIRFPDGIIRLSIDESDPAVRLQATREFYLAPFRSALGNRRALDRKQVEDDSQLAYVVGFFDDADRNGDGRLTPAELEAFLELVEAGVRSQAGVTIVDREKNLFDLLDENQDGRLDRRELNRAALLVAEGAAALPRSKVPYQIVLGVERSSAAKSFGPVLLVGTQRSAVVAKTVAARGPKWFLAMDRNGDGFVSPAEFLGPTETFALLDLDRDGFISAEEAERAESNAKKANKMTEKKLP